MQCGWGHRIQADQRHKAFAALSRCLLILKEVFTCISKGLWTVVLCFWCVFPSFSSVHLPCLNHKNLAGNFCTGSAFPFRLPPKGTQNQGQIEEVPEPKAQSLIPLLLPLQLQFSSVFCHVHPWDLSYHYNTQEWENWSVYLQLSSTEWSVFDLLFEEDKIDLRHPFSLEFRSAHSFAGSWYSWIFACILEKFRESIHIFLCVSECFEFLKNQWIFTAGNMNPISTFFFIYHKILQGRLTCTSVFKNWRPRWQSNLLFVNL